MSGWEREWVRNRVRRCVWCHRSYRLIFSSLNSMSATEMSWSSLNLVSKISASRGEYVPPSFCLRWILGLEGLESLVAKGDKSYALWVFYGNRIAYLTEQYIIRIRNTSKNTESTTPTMICSSRVNSWSSERNGVTLHFYFYFKMHATAVNKHPFIRPYLQF